MKIERALVMKANSIRYSTLVTVKLTSTSFDPTEVFSETSWEYIFVSPAARRSKYELLAPIPENVSPMFSVRIDKVFFSVAGLVF